MPLTGDKKRAYQRNYVAERRKLFIESRGSKCITCGSSDKLEVDHIDREQKVYNPRDIWSRRKEVRDAELAKCQVLCSPCHIKKTQLERDWS